MATGIIGVVAGRFSFRRYRAAEVAPAGAVVSVAAGLVADSAVAVVAVLVAAEREEAGNLRRGDLATW